MEAIKLCRLDTPIIFIEARINLSRFVVTGCAAKTSATVTFPSLNLISLFAFSSHFVHIPGLSYSGVKSPTECQQSLFESHFASRQSLSDCPVHFSKLFLILKSGVNHTSRGSISTSTLPSIKLRKCSSKIITSILSFISGRLATKSNQIKQLIRNGRSASLQRTFKKSFTSFSHSTRNKTRDGLIRVRNIRALNGRFNTSITHAYSIVIGSKHITLNATGGG